VAFNRRGVEDKHSNISSSTGDTSVQGGTLGKIECIDVIAGAVQTVTSHTAVDLVNPEVFDRLSCDSTLMFNLFTYVLARLKWNICLLNCICKQCFIRLNYKSEQLNILYIQVLN
jgi:hypothetical protein